MNCFFVKDTSKVNIKYPNNTILVYHPDYKYPKYNDITYYTWEKYCKNYSSLEPSCIILVGLNALVTPQNRCDFIQEYLSTLTANVFKISIDSSPFVGEPWRIFFHYLYTNTNLFNVPYSYTLETEWKHWFYRDKVDCRLSGNNIGMFIKNTYSDLDLLDTKFIFYDIEKKDIDFYNKIKEDIFNKYDSPKFLMNNLLKECNNYFKLKISFDSYRQIKKNNFLIHNLNTYEVPNIPLYNFIVEENLRRLNTYNAIIKKGYSNESI